MSPSLEAKVLRKPPGPRASNPSDDYPIRWFNRLEFRVVVSFAALFVLVVASLFVIGRTVGESLVRNQAHQTVASAGGDVLAELERRATKAHTIAHNMARAAELVFDHESAPLLLREMMNPPGAKNVIAGGGVWPEPFKFADDCERCSVFWGRNAEGRLEFYNDYNLPEGAGYHREEWYVPARYLPEGRDYWSKPYIDPHSRQPMVTVSTPMYRDGELLGVATVDLKLEGIAELLAEASADFGGYAFIVDRSGRLLSFPDEKMVRDGGTRRSGKSLEPYIHIDALARRYPEYSPVVAIVDSQMGALNQRSEAIDKMAETISAESYQIGRAEARRISSAYFFSREEDWGSGHVGAVINSDFLLGEKVYVSVTTMPNTFWNIVTVMPDSAARREAAEFVDTLFNAIIYAIFTVLLVTWLLIRAQLTLPLKKMSLQLRTKLQQPAGQSEMICTDDRGELGALTHWFNQRTRQLLDSQQAIEHLAFYDTLTGLPNRHMLHVKLQELLLSVHRGELHFALLFLDLDRFKHINDSLGHGVGDHLLVQIGDRLRRGVVGGEMVARIGGDEFVSLVLSPVAERAALVARAEHVATQITELLATPFGIHGNDYYISSSIGISLCEDGNATADDLLKQADTAMYHAKSNGRNTYCVFQSTMQQRADHRLKVEKELRHAIDNGQLELYFQPQVDSSGQCRSAEALVRWNHPERGVVAPDEFIPIAEDSALIERLGRWVLRASCAQLQGWQSEGIYLDHIAINVCARQFHCGDIVQDVRDALAYFDVDPSRITLEITEGVIIENIIDTTAKMNELKALGVRMSLDDFGTGYSSMRYLKQLPIYQLKIDQSFVRDVASDDSDLVIVETILAMAHHMRLEVVAEGVETPEQLQLLAERRCEYFQGHYFCRPVPDRQFVAYVKEARNAALAELQADGGIE